MEPLDERRASCQGRAGDDDGFGCGARKGVEEVLGDAVRTVVEVLEVRVRLPVAGEGVRLRHDGGDSLDGGLSCLRILLGLRVKTHPN